MDQPEPVTAFTSRQRNLLWIFFGLAAGLSLLWQLFPLADAADRLAVVPQNGIYYESHQLSLKPDEAKIWKSVAVVRREYRHRLGSFILTIVDGTKDRHSIHDPFYCMRGSGWEIESANEFPIAGGEARLVRVKKENKECEALIWFSDGKSRHSSARWYWWKTTLRRLSLGASGAEPVLVTIQSNPDHPINWRKLIEEFPSLLEF